MDGSAKNLSETIRGTSRFYIPVYQRNYDWDTENCQRLMDDLEKVYSLDLETYFFGSLVFKPGNKHQETIVIDGQQRLTTISLMLLALSHYMQDKELKDEQINYNLIVETYLIDTWGQLGDNYRIKLNPRDDQAYKKLYGDRKLFDSNSNITKNYNFFYNYFVVHNSEPRAILDAFRRLEVMIVNLNSPHDDPQQIFESLNSTGRALTDADRIRNFLLMNEKQDRQEYYFNIYWQKLESLTNLELEEFFRHYLTVKQDTVPVKRKVYLTFQDYYEHTWQDKEKFFKDLIDHAFAYNQILEANTDNRKINGYLYRFSRLKMTVVYPFLMALLVDYNSNALEANDVLDMFAIVESYIIRRTIVNLPTSALNKIFANLYFQIKKYLPYGSGYADSISFVLLQKTGSGAFPSDHDFVAYLKNINMYERNPRIRLYFFERLENYDHVERINIYEGFDEGEFSIEHIMPQTLNLQWKQELGENYDYIHENYVNNLGNLTITGYNSKYSNRSFKEKKTMEKGFDESHFTYLNKLPRQVDHWGEKEILERQNDLISHALQIFSAPTTSIKMKDLYQDNLEPFSGEKTYTNYRLKGYKFRDEYISVNWWSDMYRNIFQIFAEENPMYFYQIAESNLNSGLQQAIHNKKKKRSDYELIPNVYLEVSTDNENKMSKMRELFDQFGIDYDELMLDVRPPEKE